MIGYAQLWSASPGDWDAAGVAWRGLDAPVGRRRAGLADRAAALRAGWSGGAATAAGGRLDGLRSELATILPALVEIDQVLAEFAGRLRVAKARLAEAVALADRTGVAVDRHGGVRAAPLLWRGPEAGALPAGVGARPSPAGGAVGTTVDARGAAPPPVPVAARPAAVQVPGAEVGRLPQAQVVAGPVAWAAGWARRRRWVRWRRRCGRRSRWPTRPTGRPPPGWPSCPGRPAPAGSSGHRRADRRTAPPRRWSVPGGPASPRPSGAGWCSTSRPGSARATGCRRRPGTRRTDCCWPATGRPCWRHAGRRRASAVGGGSTARWPSWTGSPGGCPPRRRPGRTCSGSTRAVTAGRSSRWATRTGPAGC